MLPVNLVNVDTAVVAVSGASETAITVAAVTGLIPVIFWVACYPGAANQNAVLVKTTNTSGAVIGAIPSLTTSGNIPGAQCWIEGATSGAIAAQIETPQLNTNRLTIAYGYRLP